MFENVNESDIIAGLNSFEQTVPSFMIYNRAVHEKYAKLYPWPRSFNTQPPGFEFVKNHTIKIPKQLPDTNECGKGVAYLMSKDGVVLKESYAKSSDSIIDHPIMTLARDWP